MSKETLIEGPVPDRALETLMEDLAADRALATLAASISEQQFTTMSEETLIAVDDALNQIWKRDHWERRLAPFMDLLARDDDWEPAAAFRRLIGLGCQPDLLADGFYRAVVETPSPAGLEEAERDRQKIAHRLEKIADDAETHLASVRRQGLGTPMREDLPRTLRTFADTIRSDRAVIPHRRRASRRRNPRGSRALVWLLKTSTHIKDVTGRPRTGDVGVIINAVRATSGLAPIEPETTLPNYTHRARQVVRTHRAMLEAIAATMTWDPDSVI
jgi:predicted HAD superfamily Cof-like phosphohydrolase